MRYESFETVCSALQPGVVYKVNRMSFGRRLELMRRVREIVPRLECFQAGTSQQDRAEANLLSAEIDKLYLEWGLIEVRGLEIDGKAADPQSLSHSGPEELFFEALGHVKAACRLSESETKN